MKHYAQNIVKSVRRQRGFTMIEVLVAVLILAIGLLGVAGVQLLSMQQTSNANKRSVATLYAQDLAERMRANGDSNLNASDLSTIETNMKKSLGPGSEVDVAINGSFAEIEIKWNERDSFAEGNESTQTLTMRARL